MSFARCISCATSFSDRKVRDGCFYRELRAESLIVSHLAFFEVNRNLIVVDVFRSLHQLRNFVFTQTYGEEAVLRGVIGENVREGRRDDRAETEVGQSPHRMLARRSAAEVLSCNQNARAFIARLVQYEVGVLAPIRAEAPVIEHKLAKARALDPLQKLLGDDLVGIDVDPVERRDESAMDSKWFHRVFL